MTLTEFIVYLLLTPFAILLTTLTHETSHLVVAKLAGWKVTGFHILPRKYEGKIIFGAVEYEPIENNWHYFPIMCSIPLWKSFLFFVLFLMLALAYYLPLAAFAMSELADYFSWWWGWLKKDTLSDGGAMREWNK